MESKPLGGLLTCLEENQFQATKRVQQKDSGTGAELRGIELGNTVLPSSQIEDTFNLKLLK